MNTFSAASSRYFQLSPANLNEGLTESLRRAKEAEALIRFMGKILIILTTIGLTIITPYSGEVV
jgi:hypothetical protein